MRLRQLFDRFLGSGSSSESAASSSTTTLQDGLVLGYAPDADGDADPGEVVWTWVAYEEDPSQGKDRPVVVLGRYPDGRVAGLMLTSKDHGGDPDYHLVGSGGWDHEGRPSWVKLDRLIVMGADDLRREGARLDEGRYDAVVAAWLAVR